jgi:hypothetical protein
LRAVGLGILVITRVPAILIAGPNRDQLANFLQSPLPIRELIVEGDWYGHTSGKTHTNWIAIAWQPEGYILRESHEQVELFDVFDPAKDDLITVRSGDIYWAISQEPTLGVHIEEVRSLTNSGVRDIVTPKVLGQEKVVSFALMLGLDGPLRGITMTKDGFSYRDGDRKTVLGVINTSLQGEVTGLSLTNHVEPLARTNEEGIVERDDGASLPIIITYTYAESLPAWFPHEIKRDIIVGDETVSICNLIVQRLELGEMPIYEFNPKRFLPQPSPNHVITTNGVSVITMSGVARTVIDPKDPRAKGIEFESHKGGRTVFVILALALLLVPLSLMRWRKGEK